MIYFTHGSWDILHSYDLKKLFELIQSCKEKGDTSFGVGIYDTDLCSQQGLPPPLKDLDSRMKILSYIKGVDFVFPVTSLDPEILKNSAKAAFIDYQKNKNTPCLKEEKPFKLGYVPGTHDIFHNGHLENLLYAASQCEKLIVGVKADSLVEAHKHKRPYACETERAAILKYFKFVAGVHTYDTRDLRTAITSISSEYNQPVDAIFLGSDLESDFLTKYPDLNLVFTSRNLENPNAPSTSRLMKKLSLPTSYPQLTTRKPTSLPSCSSPLNRTSTQEDSR
jgi:cytidyltransferase-like protein